MSGRPMGFWMTLALVMGSMIGSGIFLLPANLAPLGWASVAGWLITIGGMLCIAATIAQLAKALPQAGGPYAFTRAAFGDGAGFLIAWSFWISVWVGCAAIVTAGVSYLSRLFPVLESVPGASAASSIGFVWLFTLINIRGARVAGGVQIAALIIKLIPLMLVLVIAATVLATAEPLSAVVRPPEASEFTSTAIASAAALTLWAMLGIETASVPAEKVANPSRTVPLATLIGASIAGLLYLLVCSAIVLMLPPEQTAVSTAPFADFVQRYWGQDAGLMIAGFGAVSALGALNGWIMVQGEIPYALARSGLFPAVLMRTTAAGVPWAGHLLSSLLLTIVVALNYSRTMADLFQFLILLTGSISLFTYLACVASAARLMHSGTLPARLWLRAVLLVGGVYGLWTIYGAGLEAAAWASALIAGAWPVYWLARRQRS